MENRTSYEKLLLELGKVEHNYFLAIKKAKEKKENQINWLWNKYEPTGTVIRGAKPSKEQLIREEKIASVKKKYEEEIMFAEMDRDIAKAKVFEKLEGNI